MEQYLPVIKFSIITSNWFESSGVCVLVPPAIFFSMRLCCPYSILLSHLEPSRFTAEKSLQKGEGGRKKKADERYEESGSVH